MAKEMAKAIDPIGIQFNKVGKQSADWISTVDPAAMDFFNNYAEMFVNHYGEYPLPGDAKINGKYVGVSDFFILMG